MPFSAGIQLPEPHRDTTRKIIHIDMDAFFFCRGTGLPFFTWEAGYHRKTSPENGWEGDRRNSELCSAAIRHPLGNERI